MITCWDGSCWGKVKNDIKDFSLHNLMDGNTIY